MPTARLDILRAEARYARERFQLYKARAYGPRLTSPARLRELQRVSEGAEARLHAAEAEQEHGARGRTPWVRSAGCESFDDLGDLVEGAIACRDAGIRRSRSFGS